MTTRNPLTKLFNAITARLDSATDRVMFGKDEPVSPPDVICYMPPWPPDTGDLTVDSMDLTETLSADTMSPASNIATRNLIHYVVKDTLAALDEMDSAMTLDAVERVAREALERYTGGPAWEVEVAHTLQWDGITASYEITYHPPGEGIPYVAYYDFRVIPKGGQK